MRAKKALLTAGFLLCAGLSQSTEHGVQRAPRGIGDGSGEPASIEYVPNSTETWKLGTSGPIYLATNPLDIKDYYDTGHSTINIFESWVTVGLASTMSAAGDGIHCSSTWTLVVSTVLSAGGGGAGQITWTGIDASSWSVRYSTGISQTVPGFVDDYHVPSITPRILAFRRLYPIQSQDHTTCGGDPPETAYINFKFWRERTP